jgi:hypothetical protein
MTFDECRSVLTTIRRQQGTRCPVIRVDYGGSVFQGRLVRSDSDPEHGAKVRPPFGLLVLEDQGLTRRPELMLQIADLSTGAIRDGSGPDDQGPRLA